MLPAREPPAAGASAHETARFLDEEARELACRKLETERVLVARLRSVGASARGRLGEFIEEAVERELDARGAAPPGIGSASDRDAGLSDQLFRARRVGAKGIAVALGPLHAATSTVGALEPEDSATLRFWAQAGADRPVWLLLDAADVTTGAYSDPIALASWLFASPQEDAGLLEECESAPLEECESAPPPVAEAVVEAVAAPLPPAPPVVVAVAPPVSVAAPAPPAVRHSDLNAPWRSWVQALDAARGPQALASFEKLFTRDYMPLANEIALGLDDARAVNAHEEFRRTFSRAYAEACPTFALTGKRPRMVLDAPDLAARIARLHGARSTQLLLVDAMRFDVGAIVRDHARRALGSRASLTDDLLLWSALPSTTTRQLETLQRGMDALRVPPTTDAEREPDPLRGRTAEVIRRVKVGSRDFYKLDVIEAKVRDLGTDALPVLGEIAGSAAEAIVKHAQTLQPRTLLFVFGDHGFALDRDGTARQGGSSPEEVLVPAFALLIGEVH
ncbi:MAG TPA: hypothetical protein VGI39_28985 [Polyangiaceae bacterium]